MCPQNVRQGIPFTWPSPTKSFVTDAFLLGWEAHLSLLKVLIPYKHAETSGHPQCMLRLLGTISDTRWFTYLPKYDREVLCDQIREGTLQGALPKGDQCVAVLHQGEHCYDSCPLVQGIESSHGPSHQVFSPES